MAELLLRRACERFRCQITEDDRSKIETKTTLVDVRFAVEEIEQYFAARQDLRYFERLSPFLDAVERLSAPVDTLCNGTPFLPWIWAPLKLILQVSRHHSHALEKILSAYGEIGAALPRMTRYSEAFSDNFELQQLLGHLCEDIINFHSRAYQLIRKPGWKIFFSSGWGRFEHHFDALLQGMKRNSDLIDKEATSFEIVQAKEWRTRSDETSMLREKIWQSEQREAVLKWLQDDATNQEMKFEWLRSHYCKGTSQWVTKTTEIEKWLQTSTGSRHLWLYGKPGSGKSILSSQLIHHIREEGKSVCFFFFCDYHTASYSVTIQILRSICVQMIKKSPDLVAFVYDEVIQHGRTLSLAALKPLFKSLVQSFQDVRLIVDGLDEVDSSQHRSILAELDSLVKDQDNCKILVSSQDIPSIHAKLKSKPKLSMAANESGIADDISVIVDAGIANLMDTLDPDIPDSVVQDLRHSLIRNADGMFLWVHLVLRLLENSSNIRELKVNIQNLPKDLEQAYAKILQRTTNHSLHDDVSKLRRVFGWMLLRKGSMPLRKHELRLAMSLHTGQHHVDEDTKPFPNALDICKPFIEEGPGGLVVFIHSTFPTFLSSPSNGSPFISVLDANHDIALACVLQMIDGFKLISGQRDCEDHMYRVGHGFHALVPYASNHWMSHLTDYLNLMENEGNIPFDVLTQLEHLATKYHEEVPYSSELEDCVHRNVPSSLRSYPEVYSMICHYFESGKKTPELGERPEATTEPSPFRRIQRIYRQFVLHLLSRSSHAGLSQATLISFKQDYRPGAYVCLNQGCDKAVFGFDSMANLKSHEASHQGTLRCVEVGCTYNDVGFTSIRQLQGHKRKSHPEMVLRAIPKRLRAAEDEPSPELASSQSLSPDPSTKATQDSQLAHLAANNNDSRTRPSPIQINQILYQTMVAQNQIHTGWQAGVAIQERMIKVHNLITNISLAVPNIIFMKAVEVGVNFEREAFAKSNSQEKYERQMSSKTNEFFRRRQVKEASMASSQPIETATQATLDRSQFE